MMFAMRRKQLTDRFYYWIHRHPALTLMIIAPIFSEILTSQIFHLVDATLLDFLNPKYLLTTAFPVSLTALLCREMVVRWKTGFRGLLFIAIAFGLFRTAMVERSIFDPALIDSALAGNGMVWGINLKMLVTYTFDQAFIGIVASITIINAAAPDKAEKKWLNIKTMGIGIAGPTALITAAWVLEKEIHPAAQTVVIAGVVLLLIAAAAIPARKKEISSGIISTAASIITGLIILGLPMMMMIMMSPLEGTQLAITIVVLTMGVLITLSFISRQFKHFPLISQLYFTTGFIVFISTLITLDDMGVFTGKMIIAFAALLLIAIVRGRLLEYMEDNK